MPYCAIIDNPDASEDRFEQVKAHLRAIGAFPPEGQRLLIAGPSDPGWRVISVWDSEDALERFYTQMLPAALTAIGAAHDRMTRVTFEVQTLVAGDLAGAPQPA